MKIFFFLFYLTGYQATGLSIVPYCVEWATHGVPIVGSQSEVFYDSRIKKKTKIYSVVFVSRRFVADQISYIS